MAAIVPVLTQLVGVLNQLVATLASQAQAQAQAGAGAVQGAVAGDAGTGAGVEGGGAAGQVGQSAHQAGCGCGCSHGGMTATPQSGTEQRPAGADGGTEAHGHSHGPITAPPPAAGAAATRGGKIDGDGLTVKGAKMNAEQRRLAEIVLRTGQEMGANRKVLETAVSTMIQESVIKNDSSVDSKDHDSLGLFQQRPSAGWGSREQISDPAYAARKFFEKAIANDRKNPDQPKTRLAQSVQISAFPDAYAKWDKEAEAIVADFLG
jgi:hypothetical protein